MSPTYRLMIYFAVATLHFYRDSIISIESWETLGTFAERNRAVLDRVGQEARNLFGYELSHLQIGKAIAAYVAHGQNVEGTKAATTRESHLTEEQS